MKHLTGMQPRVAFTVNVNEIETSKSIVLCFDKEKKLIGWSYMLDKIDYAPGGGRAADLSTIGIVKLGLNHEATAKIASAMALVAGKRSA